LSFAGPHIFNDLNLDNTGAEECPAQWRDLGKLGGGCAGGRSQLGQKTFNEIFNDFFNNRVESGQVAS
jgi:hypothetical protein